MSFRVRFRRLESLKTFWSPGVPTSKNFKNFILYGLLNAMSEARHKQQGTRISEHIIP